jgi:hypothetical protein
MLTTFGLVLVIFWLVGLLGNIGGPLVHVLLVGAAGMFLANIANGQHTT